MQRLLLAAAAAAAAAGLPLSAVAGEGWKLRLRCSLQLVTLLWSQPSGTHLLLPHTPLCKPGSPLHDRWHLCLHD
jgi:hypothetical protein